MLKIGHIQIKRIEATLAFNCSQAPIDADAHKLQRWQQAAKWSRETLICNPTDLRSEKNRTQIKKWGLRVELYLFNVHRNGLFVEIAHN